MSGHHRRRGLLLLISCYFYLSSMSFVSCWTTTRTSTVGFHRRGVTSATTSTTTAMKLNKGGDNNGDEPLFSQHQSSSSSSSMLCLPELVPGRKRLYLLRHGQTDWNMQGRMQGGGYDLPLNGMGVQQASATGTELSRLCPQLRLVVSSPLKRALQTSLHVHCKHREESDGITRLVDRRFGEMRFGDFEGMVIRGPDALRENKRRYAAMLERLCDNVHLRWPSTGASDGSDDDQKGESVFEVSERGVAALDNLLDRYEEHHDHIAIVAHGRFNKILLSTLLFDGDCGRFNEIQQDNACVNVVDYDPVEDRWEPVVINYSVNVAADVKAKTKARRQEKSRRRPLPRIPLPAPSFATFNNSTFGGGCTTNSTMMVPALCSY